MELCGVYLNRGRMVSSLISALLLLLPFFFGEQILLLLNQDPEVSVIAAKFINCLLPGVFVANQYDLMRRWLICLKYSVFPMVILMASVVLHVPLAIYMVTQTSYGIYSLGIVSFITGVMQLIAILVYSQFKAELKDGLFWPRRDSFEGWGEYLSISIPAMIMICSEWWFYEILVVMAGMMGVVQLNV